MSKLHLKKGDNVLVIAGTQKGKKAQFLALMLKNKELSLMVSI